MPAGPWRRSWRAPCSRTTRTAAPPSTPPSSMSSCQPGTHDTPLTPGTHTSNGNTHPQRQHTSLNIWNTHPSTPTHPHTLKDLGHTSSIPGTHTLQHLGNTPSTPTHTHTHHTNFRTTSITLTRTKIQQHKQLKMSP